MDDTIIAPGGFVPADDWYPEDSGGQDAYAREAYDQGNDSDAAPEENDSSADQAYMPLPNEDVDYGYYDAEEELPPKEPPEPKIKYKRKRTPILVRLLLYGAFVLAAGIGLGLFGWECAQDVLALGHADRTVQMVVTETDTIDTVTDKLYERGLIRHKWLFKLYCDITHAEEKIDPGVYELNSLYDYHALVSGMIRSTGNRATTEVMIAEGRNCREIFELLEENSVCTVEELERAALEGEYDYWFLEGLDTTEPNWLEGFLYPDTYEFYISDDAENVIDRILRNFERRVDDELRLEIENSGYTVREVITIASLIEEEAAGDHERAEISSVIHNRLAVADNDTVDDDYLLLLQMDSTVFYACELAGIEGFDLSVDSPYNTYLYQGLPAGPIDNPGMNSIKAALKPAETDYYYFAAGADGSSHFFNDFSAFQEFITSSEYVGYRESDETD